MEVLLGSLEEHWYALLRIAPRIAAAVVVLLICLLIGRALGTAVGSMLQRGKLSTTHRSFFRRLVVWAMVFVGFVLALNVVGLEQLAASLLAGGGVTAIVIGFAFRGIGENLLAGLFLAFSRPFEIGDLIGSGDHQGTVRSIELRYTHIRTEDGRDVFIPSAEIFSGVLVNLTRDGLRRLSFSVGIDYANDAEKARLLLLEGTSGVGGVLEDPEPLVMISEFADQYVGIQVSFWIDMFAKRPGLPPIRTLVMERCRRLLLENGFTISSDVTTNVALEGRRPVEVAIVTTDR